MIKNLKQKMFEALKNHDIKQAYELKREYERLEIIQAIIGINLSL